ncbi:MAG: DUF502 domain-containing protein [Alphaproteobacteria bacterium]|nr:DUF502 domain-containing protein [Alphaproteobacteria bacterium]
MNHFVRTLLSGFLLLLPVAITAVLVIWLGTYIFAYVRPGSVFGSTLTAIGLGFTGSTVVAYLIGLVVLIIFVYTLGLIVESGLRNQFSGFIDSSMRRIPVVRNVYDLTKRFVAIVDAKDADGLKGMRPVWCFFGGPGSAAALALLPSPEVIELDGVAYHAILVPSAPVPIGGGLLYVPAEWIKPADIGVEGLMSVYVSMGVSMPTRADLARRPALIAPAGPAAPAS